MKSIHKFTIEHSFNKPLENIYKVILDFIKFGHFHPHMKQVKIVSHKHPNEIEYEVDEKLLLYGFIPMCPNYKATVIEKEKNKHIQYISEVKKNVYLTINFNFLEENGNIKVIEDVDLKANALIAFTFLSLLKKAHLQTFKNFNTIGYNA